MPCTYSLLSFKPNTFQSVWQASPQSFLLSFLDTFVSVHLQQITHLSPLFLYTSKLYPHTLASSIFPFNIIIKPICQFHSGWHLSFVSWELCWRVNSVRVFSSFLHSSSQLSLHQERVKCNTLMHYSLLMVWGVGPGAMRHWTACEGASPPRRDGRP